jgi:GNAT superfamily N-acetyltransferase
MQETVKLGTNEVHQLAPLVAGFKFKPYHYYQIDNHRLNKYFFSLIKNEDTILVIKNEEKIQGAAIIIDLPWDSGLFGIKMAKANFIIDSHCSDASQNVINQLIWDVLCLCKEKEIEHLSCQVESKYTELIHALEANGFLLMDTIVIYSASLRRKKIISQIDDSEILIREVNDKDLKRIFKIAEKAFFDPETFLSRFYMDPLLKVNAGKLYKEWLRNSCEGSQADIVFVAEVDKAPVGFITCRLQERKKSDILGLNIVIIPLNAVHPEFRGRGIYNRLVVHSFNWFREQNVDFAEIKTQVITSPVHHTWQKLGGKLVSSYHTFHKEL